MAEHYFTSSPTSEHDIRTIVYSVRGGVDELTFETDAGVFSKTKIDRGTEELLKAVLADEGQSFLDLGCGYGPVGIIVAKMFPSTDVWMADINERACELARSNAKRNGVSRINVVCGDGFVPLGDRRFDIVATNPPIRAGKGTTYRLVEEARDHLNPGGRFYAVVRTKQGAASFRAFVADTFGAADEPEKGGGYRVIRAVR